MLQDMSLLQKDAIQGVKELLLMELLLYNRKDKWM